MTVISAYVGPFIRSGGNVWIRTLIGLCRSGSQNEVVYMARLSAHQWAADFECTSYYIARPL